MEPVVLITGASGGLGQALVHQFHASGWRVGAGFHSKNVHTESEGLWPLHLDVTNRLQACEAVDQLLARWQRLDVLINNAGLVADDACWSLDLQKWEKVLNVNLKGAFLCAQAVLPTMLQQRSGHIINVASFSARSGQRGQSNYAAAKAGVIGLTESLAREVGNRNIRVNAVLPGVLPTGMTAHLNAASIAQFAFANVLGRINSLEEVARFIFFFSGLQNVSGQCFQIDSRIARWT